MGRARTGIIAGAEMLHETLLTYLVGQKFIGIELLNATRKRWGDDHITIGMLNGYLNKSRHKGMVTIVGKQRHSGHRQKLAVYELLEHQDRKFKSRSKGSTKGRNHIHTNIKATVGVPELPFDKDANIRETVKQMGIKVIDMPIADDNKNSKILDGLKDAAKGNIGKLTHVMVNTSISDILLDCASKVAELENRQEKTLKDFSTDELIKEIRSRINE